MIRRFLTAMLAALMLVSLAGALAAENWYVQKGMEMAAHIGELARDESYRALYTSTDEIHEMIAALGEEDFANPVSVRMLVLPNEEQAQLPARFASLFGLDTGGLSPLAMEELTARLPGMLPGLFNGREGAVWLATASALTTSRACVQPEGFQPCTLFFEYGGDYAMGVGFAQGEEGAVMVSASPMKAGAVEDMLNGLSATERSAMDRLFRRVPLD